jgi:type IV pilus assembly protein PilY1
MQPAPRLQVRRVHNIKSIQECKMKNHLSKYTVATLLLAVPYLGSAADIDLYINNTTATQSNLPNVLFIIDNTANWNQAFANEMSALANTFSNMPENKFNVGIMLSTETGGGNAGERGGYVRAALRTMNATNKIAYKNLINSLDKLNDKSNGGASGVTMAEAWNYFSGGTPYSGNQKEKTDYTGNSLSGYAYSNAVYALAGNALASKNATSYIPPVASGSCARNFIIYISNGPNQQSSSLDTVTNNLLSTAAGGGAAGTAATSVITLNPSGSQSNPSDEWARFMYKSSLGIVTYTIDVDAPTTGQGPGWTAMLKSMAKVSNGNYIAVSSSSGSAALEDAISDTLSKIQSVNSVFAAVSVPVSANVQRSYLNQLFVGMFRPDGDSRPRWYGNLKQYKIRTDTRLGDADGNPAVNSNTGFITECARSFWTPAKTSTDAYWENDPRGDCIPPSGSAANLYKASNTPDGNVVEKGAQGYVLRSGTPASRVVKTCSSTFSSCTTLTNFNNTTVSAAALGAASTTERDQLINWARGENIDTELSKTSTVMRPSVHGDIVHSNPFAINYASGDVVVYYGGNDGLLRAINGNQTASIGTVAAGGELWAFMPPEFYSQIKRLRDNTTPITYFGDTSGLPKPWGMDGPISAYKDSTRTWIFAPMRRGGRALYAFDVTTPASPTLKWKVGCPNLANDTDCKANFSGIGQTWGMAQPFKASGYGAGASPMLIMGGGYDDCEDSDPNTCTSSSKGNKIFVVDADTGTHLKTFDTDRSVIGDIKLVPGTNGLAKYGYAADLGGNLYRITIDTAAPAAWTITKIASLGCDTVTTCSAHRKFMFAPDVIPEADGSYSLYIGSGDREKPLSSSYYPNATSVPNYFFKVIDNPTDTTWLSSESTRCDDQEVICLASLSSAGTTSNNCTAPAQPPTSAKGWALGMRTSEQVVTSAATLYDVTTFSTHVPATAAANSCSSNLGTTRVYNLNTDTAQPDDDTTCNDLVSGGGLPPPPKKLCVAISGDTCQDICIGCRTESPLETGEVDDPPPPSSSLGARGKRKLYWFIEK